MEKKIFILLGCFLLCSCSKDNINQVFNQTILTLDNNTNSSLMFFDGEAMEDMTSDWRIYEIGKVIRVKPFDNYTIEIANFAPIDIENANILMTINGVAENIKLLKISKIRAHGKTIIKYPFIDGLSSFITTKNNVVDLSEFKQNGLSPQDVSFDFTGSSNIIEQLKALAKLKWTIKYHDFDPNNDPNNNWADDITAKDIRRYTGLMINLGSVFISDDFKNGFLDEMIVPNDGVTILTRQDKEAIYNKLLNKTYYRCGKVVYVSGLGGSSTLGIAEHVLTNYIHKATSTQVHEIGHTLGFNHSSNMTYPKDINGDGQKTGFVNVGMRIMNSYFTNNLFPITLENYYQPIDFE